MVEARTGCTLTGLDLSHGASRHSKTFLSSMICLPLTKLQETLQEPAPGYSNHWEGPVLLSCGMSNDPLTEPGAPGPIKPG